MHRSSAKALVLALLYTFQAAYSPECVEKLFGKAVLVPNRTFEDLQEGWRSSDRPLSGGKDPRLGSLQLFSKQFRKGNSPKFGK